MEQILAERAQAGAVKNFEHRQQLIGDLQDRGLIEYRGSAYIKFMDSDVAVELWGNTLRLWAVKVVRA